MPPMPLENVASRQQLLDEANTPEALARREQMEAMFELVDNEAVTPSTGLSITTHEFASSPDGNAI